MIPGGAKSQAPRFPLPPLIKVHPPITLASHGFFQTLALFHTRGSQLEQVTVTEPITKG